MSGDQAEGESRIESLALAVIFTTLSIGLLVAMPWATRPGPASAGWWTTPALAPAAALWILVIANLATLINRLVDLRRQPVTPDEKTLARERFRGWLRPVEYLAYFAGYVALLHGVGYFLSSLTFLLWLIWRQGLRSFGWIFAGVVAAISLTIVFRAGLQIWMPRPWLFDLLPADVAKFAARWL